MTIQLTEYIARYLRGNGFDGCTSGIMPDEPDRIITVYATGLRPNRDEDGSRFQIVARGSPCSEEALADCLRAADLLDDFEGILTIDSPYIARIVLESGAASIGADEKRRLMYSANFRAWVC